MIFTGFTRWTGLQSFQSSKRNNPGNPENPAKIPVQDKKRPLVAPFSPKKNSHQ
jgi:hypothetical protein